MKKINKVLDWIAKILSIVSYAGIVLGVLFIVVDVVMRYVFRSPIPGDYDITQVWLCSIVFAAFASVQKNKAHINVTMLIKIFPPRLAVCVYGVANLVATFISGACAYSCFLLAQKAVMNKMVTMMIKIPMYPFEYFEALCLAIFCIVLLADAITYFIAAKDKKTCEEIVSTWA